MGEIYRPSGVSKAAFWTGILLSSIAVLFDLFDSISKIMQPDYLVKATVQSGYPASAVLWIGVIMLVCTILYLVPQTSILGLVLTTGYLGGAIATIITAKMSFAFVAMPILVALLLWGGLWLRDAKLRELLPIRK